MLFFFFFFFQPIQSGTTMERSLMPVSELETVAHWKMCLEILSSGMLKFLRYKRSPGLVCDPLFAPLLSLTLIL